MSDKKNGKANDAAKMREIVYRPAVTLPAISTAHPAREYYFSAFLGEFVLSAKGLQSAENMADNPSPPVFEIEEAIEALYAKTRKEMTLEEPTTPKTPEMRKGDSAEDKAANLEAAEAYMEALAAYTEARKPYDEALNAIRVGRSFYISDTAFQAAKVAAQEAIDKKITPAGGAPAEIDPVWGRKVLRHFWAFAQSRAVALTDIPVEVSAGATEPTPPANGTSHTLTS